MSARLDYLVAEARRSLLDAGFDVESALVLPHGRDDSPPRLARLEVTGSTGSSYAVRVGLIRPEVTWCSTYFDFPDRVRDLGPSLARVPTRVGGRYSARFEVDREPRFARNSDVARVVAVRTLDSVAPLLPGSRTNGPLSVSAALYEALSATGVSPVLADWLAQVLSLRESALKRVGEADGFLSDLESGAPLGWALRRLGPDHEAPSW